MIRFYIRLWGLILTAAGLVSGFLLFNALFLDLERQLAALPDHDYIPEIKALIREKRFARAGILCDDVIASGSPDKTSAGILRKICQRELGSVRSRLWRAGKAFVTGNPGSSLEEAGGAVLSDMILYGDLRDLALQGYYKITGKETDWFIAALAAAGLAAEAFDAVDWAPACLKALRRTAAVSDTLGRSLIKCFKNSKTAFPVLRDLRVIYFKGGFIRTRMIVRTFSRAEDLKWAAAVCKTSPGTAALIARSAGKRAPEAFVKLRGIKTSPAFLKRLFLKGPRGVTLLLRGTKSFRKGSLPALLLRTAVQFNRLCGPWAFVLPAVLTVTGGVLLLPKKKKKKAEQPEK